MSANEFPDTPLESHRRRLADLQAEPTQNAAQARFSFEKFTSHHHSEGRPPTISARYPIYGGRGHQETFQAIPYTRKSVFSLNRELPAGRADVLRIER